MIVESFTESSTQIAFSWVKAIDPSYAILESKKSGPKLRETAPRKKSQRKKVDVFAFSLILYEIIAGEMDVVAVKVKERLERAIAVGQSRLGNRWPLREFQNLWRN
jgi:hypothetical protein